MKSNSMDYKRVHAGHQAVQTPTYKSTSALKQKVSSQDSLFFKSQ